MIIVILYFFLSQLHIERGSGRYINRPTFSPYVYNRVLQREKVRSELIVSLSDFLPHRQRFIMTTLQVICSWNHGYIRLKLPDGQKWVCDISTKSVHWSSGRHRPKQYYPSFRSETNGSYAV